MFHVAVLEDGAAFHFVFVILLHFLARSSEATFAELFLGDVTKVLHGGEFRSKGLHRGVFQVHINGAAIDISLGVLDLIYLVT